MFVDVLSYYPVNSHDHQIVVLQPLGTCSTDESPIHCRPEVENCTWKDWGEVGDVGTYRPIIAGSSFNHLTLKNLVTI